LDTLTTMQHGGTAPRREGTTRLAEASRIARDAAAGVMPGQVRAALRAPVHAIDRLLDDLERLNLRGGAGTEAPAVRDWLARVEGEVGAPAPAWVREVPDTVRLHAAVLRWQGQLLDRCRPDRSGIGDMHEDPLDFLLLPASVLGALLPGRYRNTGRRVA